MCSFAGRVRISLHCHSQKKSITFNAQYVLTMISMTLTNDNGDYGDNGNCVEII